VVVNTVKSTLETAQTWLPNASATVSAPAGSGDLDGTVSFGLYASTDCSGEAIYSTTADVAGASPETVWTTNTTVKATSREATPGRSATTATIWPRRTSRPAVRRHRY